MIAAVLISSGGRLGGRLGARSSRFTGSESAPRPPRSLARVKAQIPQSAEVVVSQGVLGPFSDRADVHALANSSKTPINRSSVWFVIAPSVGTELQTTASSMALVAELAGPLHATLVAQSAGVWAFRWHPPARLTVPA